MSSLELVATRSALRMPGTCNFMHIFLFLCHDPQAEGRRSGPSGIPTPGGDRDRQFSNGSYRERGAPGPATSALASAPPVPTRPGAVSHQSVDGGGGGGGGGGRGAVQLPVVAGAAGGERERERRTGADSRASSGAPTAGGGGGAGRESRTSGAHSRAESGGWGSTDSPELSSTFQRKLMALMVRSWEYLGSERS